MRTASGLLWISELIEEHSRLAKTIGQRCIYVSPPESRSARYIPNLPAGHHTGPLSSILLRLVTPQTHPILCVLPLRLSAELHTNMAVHLSHVAQLLRLVCSRGDRPLPVVLLFRADHSGSKTQSPPLVSGTRAIASYSQLRGHRDVLRDMRLVGTSVPVP